MAIIMQKPFRNVGVGALYQCFEDAAGTNGYASDVYKSEALVKIGVSEQGKMDPIYGSSKVYDNDVIVSPPTLAVEVLAYDPANLARMRGSAVSGGFVTRNRFDEGEYFAQGVVYPKRGGHFVYVWYPKCRMIETSKDHETATKDNTGGQNRTVNLQVYEFNDAGDWQIEYDTELLAVGETPLKEAAFFAAVLTEPIAEA